MTAVPASPDTARTAPHVDPDGAPSAVPWHVAAFYLLLTTSLVLYVYRFAVAGVNLSAFRALLLAWLAWLALEVVRGRVVLTRYLPLVIAGVGIAVVNAIDFATLSGFPALRRDIANHLLNVAFAGAVAVTARPEARRVALLHAFVLSSLVTSAVTLYAARYDRLPFESLIRTLGSEQAQSLAYINDDTVFTRATSTFFDPNFYGVYSMLVVLAVLHLWRFARPTRYLAVMLALNLICLALTLSRTAVIGLLAALVVLAVLDRRSRWMAGIVAASTVVLLYGATTVQSYAGAEAVREQAAALWDSVAGPEDEAASADGEAAGSSAAAGAARPGSREASGGVSAAGEPSAASRTAAAVQERVVSGRSLSDRMHYIKQGLAVFTSSPIWGGGSAALVGTSQWSSAHLSYLTLLARYGILGTLVYVAFLGWPLYVLWRGTAAHSDRVLATVLLGGLAVVYLSYDILLFFELQYLVFGLAWAAAFDARDRRARSGVA